MPSRRRGRTADSFVVDASVVAKWFNRGEQNEKEAADLRRSWLKGEAELFAPALLPFEVANSIWRNPNVKVRTAASLVQAMVDLSPTLVGLGAPLAGEAMSLARRKELTFYDAAYLALAKQLGATLLTADRDQLDSAARYTRATHISSYGRG